MRRFLFVLLAISLFEVGHSQAATSVKEIARQISSDLGIVSRLQEGDVGQIVIFEERHNSILAQIEIAHMLLRLHKNYQMKHVGLEGAFASDGQLTPGWIENLSSTSKLETLAMLLAQGEINSAEFITLAFPDVAITGIDDRDRYDAELRNEDALTGLYYLISLAEAKASDSQIDQFNELTKQKKKKEAIGVLFQNDPWVKQKYDEMNRANGSKSAEAMVRMLTEIENEATQRRITIDGELVSSMKRLQEFFKAVSQRSDTMAREATALARKTPDFPISIVIGAAHTERIVKLLQQTGHSLIVIKPKALTKERTSGNLAEDAFRRKADGRSVDSKGYLGAFLDGRTSRKPVPIVNALWFQSKAELHFATVELIRAIADEGPAPTSMPQLDRLNNVKITMPSIEVIGDEVVFQAQVKDQKGGWKDIWARAARCRDCNAEDPIQKRIDSLLAEANGGDGGKGPNNKEGSSGNEDGNSEKQGSGKKQSDNKQSNAKGTKRGAKRIGLDTFAIYSEKPEAVKESIYSS